jgi:hypothetical protein
MENYNFHISHVVISTLYSRDPGFGCIPEVSYCERFIVIMSWVVVSCSLVLGCRSFGGNCWSHFQGRGIMWSYRRLPK